MMNMKMIKIKDVSTAAVLCAIIILTTVFFVEAFVNSRFYRQSKAVSMLVRQEPVDFPELLENNAQGVLLVIKFAGSLAAAYINFEFIPLNEASTFMAILQSLPEEITIESFAYSGRDLRITGDAEKESELNVFVGALEDSDAFSSVILNYYEAVDLSFRFELFCVSSHAA